MRRNHFGSTSRQRLRDVYAAQDALMADLRQRLSAPAPREVQSGDQFQWYATARGVGHGHTQGTVESERPEPTVPRTVEDRIW
jgi:hypothetical protein